MGTPLSEFDLIKRYFTQLGNNDCVQLGVGDDAAITSVPAGYDLVTTVDTLVADVHFFGGTAPELIGYKALAVNLSDLAAMSATPVWFTLAIALPELDEPWLLAFSRGLANLASQYNITLICGDTVKGPLTITNPKVHLGLLPTRWEPYGCTLRKPITAAPAPSCVQWRANAMLYSLDHQSPYS